MTKKICCSVCSETENRWFSPAYIGTESYEDNFVWKENLGENPNKWLMSAKAPWFTLEWKQ